MRRRKCSEEQVIGILKEHDAGLSTAEVCPKYGGTNATWLSEFLPTGLQRGTEHWCRWPQR